MQLRVGGSLRRSFRAILDCLGLPTRPPPIAAAVAEPDAMASDIDPDGAFFD